jgi:hypothetical protein
MKAIRVMKKKIVKEAKTPTVQNPPGVWSSQQQREMVAALRKLRAVKGVGSSQLILLIVAQIKQAIFYGTPSDRHTDVPSILALIQGMEPENTLQLLLVVQMLAVHSGAIFHMYHANMTVGGDADKNLVKATGLMKLFAEQTDVLTKLKGKAAQKVIVEHHHLEDKPHSFNPPVAMPGSQVSEHQKVDDGQPTRKGPAVAAGEKRKKAGNVSVIG